MSKEQVEELKSHLAVVKQSPSDKIDEDFYNFMFKVKQKLGQDHYHMAYFSYEYANHIVKKFQDNMDIFNEQALPNNTDNGNQPVIEDISEEYDDSSNPDGPQAEEAKLNEGNPEEPQGDPNQPQIIQGDAPQAQGIQEEDIEDKDICCLNLQLALDLYKREQEKIEKGESSVDLQQVLDGIKRARTRLGDLYMLTQEHENAIEEYKKVIEMENKRQGSSCSRFVSQLHFLIGTNLLNKNDLDGQDCEVQAIRQFINAAYILVNYLTDVLKYDTSTFEKPTENSPKVDRFPYMEQPNDSPDVKETKGVISQLLDKIQDTHLQLKHKAEFLAEKKKITESAGKKSEFKPVDQTKTEVVHLGSFGNRKKKQESEKAKPIPPDFYPNKEENQEKKEESKTIPKSEEKQQG